MVAINKISKNMIKSNKLYKELIMRENLKVLKLEWENLQDCFIYISLFLQPLSQ